MWGRADTAPSTGTSGLHSGMNKVSPSTASYSKFVNSSQTHYKGQAWSFSPSESQQECSSLAQEWAEEHLLHPTDGLVPGYCQTVLDHSSLQVTLRLPQFPGLEGSWLGEGTHWESGRKRWYRIVSIFYPGVLVWWILTWLEQGRVDGLLCSHQLSQVRCWTVWLGHIQFPKAANILQKMGQFLKFQLGGEQVLAEGSWENRGTFCIFRTFIWEISTSQ